MLIEGFNRAILALVVWIAQDFGAILGHLFIVALIAGEVEEDAASIMVRHTAVTATTRAGLVSI